jgi:hypothetical protein
MEKRLLDRIEQLAGQVSALNGGEGRAPQTHQTVKSADAANKGRAAGATPNRRK